MKIMKAYEASYKAYGSIRIALAVNQNGKIASQNLIAKIMKENNIFASSFKAFKPKIIKSENPSEPNLIKGMKLTAPNQVWVSDITYIQVEGKWMYLSSIMDLYSRKIIAHIFDDNMRATLVEETLKIAISRRSIKDGLIFHSDKGSQYRSNLIKNLLRSNKIIQSMCGTGNCYDNAAMESFHSSLKKEAIYPNRISDPKTTQLRIFNYIEGFYNRRRYHSGLGYLSPDNFELFHSEKS